MENIKRHLGILLLFIFGFVLCFVFQEFFYGFIAMAWALCGIRFGLGEENKMKAFKETEAYKDLKK